GALYNMAGKDLDLALAIAEAIAEVDDKIILLALANSKMVEAGKQVGLRVASEVFADRAYQADGSLVPRKLPGAVIHDTDVAIARTVRMVKESKVTAITGEEVPLEVHSICVHGDNPSAVAFVKNIRARLEEEGVTIAPIAQIV
ncbi:MAG: LamB/YcsF family protein, partial [Oscillospiraceae bacterium]|nr:LamB/YcsF family protein [Oscillospiraceae bacterium]